MAASTSTPINEPTAASATRAEIMMVQFHGAVKRRQIRGPSLGSVRMHSVEQLMENRKLIPTETQILCHGVCHEMSPKATLASTAAARFTATMRDQNRTVQFISPVAMAAGCPRGLALSSSSARTARLPQVRRGAAYRARWQFA